MDRKQPVQRSKAITSHLVALPYSIFALLGFSLQGIVATMGAIDLVFPNLPSLLKFEIGRAIHLNLSVYWPLLGSMGAVYYFFIQEAETELYSLVLAWIQLLLYLATGALSFTLLMLGIIRGTEYQETILAIDVGYILVLAIFNYNLIRTYLKPKVVRSRVTLMTMLLGSASLIVLYIPNIFNYVHPTAHEIVRFWIVHLWEEMSKELLVIGIMVAFLLSVGSSKRKKIEKLLFLQTSLLIISATLATGHHYYWVGTPPIWLWVGGIFSVLQAGAIFLMAYIGFLGLQSINWGKISSGTKLALGFALASIFYHLSGAALLGLAIAIPQLNRYCHGTYLTSAHAHLAVFGALGMLVLGGCTYILTKDAKFTPREALLGWGGFIFINMGLLAMSTALAIAGLLQTYLWRVTGMEFTAAHALLKPYLMGRAAGGAMFAGGDLLFVWAIYSVVWRHRENLLKKFFGTKTFNFSLNHYQRESFHILGGPPLSQKHKHLKQIDLLC